MVVVYIQYQLHGMYVYPCRLITLVYVKSNYRLRFLYKFSHERANNPINIDRNFDCSFACGRLPFSLACGRLPFSLTNYADINSAIHAKKIEVGFMMI